MPVPQERLLTLGTDKVLKERVSGWATSGLPQGPPEDKERGQGSQLGRTDTRVDAVGTSCPFCFYFSQGRVSSSLGCFQTHWVVKDEIELLILPSGRITGMLYHVWLT